MNRPHQDPSTVLVVDNDEDLLEAVCARLASLGLEAIPARSSAQAMAWVRECPIDFVISDIRMPGLDGIGLAEDIRQLSAVPVILMTAFPEDYADSVQHIPGASLIAKPFAWDTLLQLLEQAREART